MNYADKDQLFAGSHLDDNGNESGPDDGYQVIDLDSEEDRGTYETIAEARGCVAYDRLKAYAIWHNGVRIEHCDPYAGDDARAKQGLGE
jgi:hypothetical protein